MKCYNEQYLNTISLKKYCFMVLRKWRMLFIAVCVGAFLLGGATVLKGTTIREVPYLSAQQATEAQEKIDANLITIVNYEAMIEDAERQLAELEERVVNYEMLYERILELQGDHTNPEVVVSLLTVVEKLDGYNNQLNTLKANVSDWQFQIDAIEMTNESLEEDLAKTVIVEDSGNLKLSVLIGAILGAGAVCAWVFAKWFLAVKLIDSENLTDPFGLILLGDFHKEQSCRKGKKCVIDRLIDRLEGDKDVLPDTYEMSAAKIRLFAGDCRRIMITGTVDKETLTNVRNALAEYMGSEYDVFAAGNPTKELDAIAKINDAKIVVVEQIGVSRQKEIRSLMELLFVGDAAVIGVLTV